MLSKFKYITMASICSIALLFSPLSNRAFATSGWQKVGFDQIILDGKNQVKSIHVDSHGGNFKAAFYGDAGYLSVELWEYDPDNPDDLVRSARTVYGHGGELVWENISDALDGSDNTAEFYLKITPQNADYGSLNVTFYD
ncbi:hypothetical protein E2K98_28790 [Bacillus salipaludis]|uniref:Secreted protein n=1 Tax=Bacillus salipaludis TaxID=2547811 RepID=A0A4R5VJP0_9BACI|nr:hypothetical protein [Bacillus salipaludis]TDK54769.1 hypothetical protein E2K98_28790 [Bacillus salipaludis]